MKKLNFEYNMSLKFSEPIFEQRYQLRCLPQENTNQKVESLIYEVDPMDSCFVVKDGFGNTAIVGNAMKEHTSFSFNVKGTVITDSSIPCNEPCHPLYSFATSLTGYSEDMAVLWDPAGDSAQQMEHLMHSIYETLTYTPDSINNSTTASQAFHQKKGVCQDYTHIMLAVCRHLHIPSRYVAGMLLGEGATHAWAEVYFDGCWHGYDPTNNRVVNDDYVVLSKGRDYSDCIIDKGIFQVRHFSKQNMNVRVIVTEENITSE